MSKNIKPLTYSSKIEVILFKIEDNMGYLALTLFSFMFILFIVTCYMVSNQPDATMNDLSPESRIELKYESLNDDKTY